MTRERLHAAARVEFALHGLQGTNLTDILKRAEVSPGAFYHHYQDKLDLFLAVAEDMGIAMRDLLRESREHLRNPQEDIVGWIANLYRSALVIAKSNEELFRIFVREFNSGNPRVQKYFQEDRAQFREELEDSMRDLMDAGYLPDIDTRWAAYVLAVFTLSATIEQLTVPADEDSWVQAMARFTLGGISALGTMPAPPPDYVSGAKQTRKK